MKARGARDFSRPSSASSGCQPSRKANQIGVVVAEEPKIGPYAAAMKTALAPVLGLPEGALGIKAKTNEGLGPVGEKRAIACYAVALLKLPD